MSNLKTVVATAKHINEQHRLARQCAETAIEHAVLCGQMLIDKKAQLEHGEFEAWVEKNCEFGLRQAQRYMQASKGEGRLAFDSLRQALGYDKQNNKSEEKQRYSPTKSVSRDAFDREESAPEVINSEQPAATPIQIQPAPVIDLSDYEPEEDDAFKANIENVLMADDKLAAMLDQLKQLHRDLHVMKESRDHYQNQSGEAVRLLKSRDREIEQLKKQLKQAKGEFIGLGREALNS